jgi:hypothetical protein
VVVTWWESNQTSNTPVMRVSADNGVTSGFGPMMTLATNGTIGEAEGSGRGRIFTRILPLIFDNY